MLMSRKSVRKFHLQVLLGLYVGSVAFRGERYPCAASQPGCSVGSLPSLSGLQCSRKAIWTRMGFTQRVPSHWRNLVAGSNFRGLKRLQKGWVRCVSPTPLNQRWQYFFLPLFVLWTFIAELQMHTTPTAALVHIWRVCSILVKARMCQCKTKPMPPAVRLASAALHAGSAHRCWFPEVPWEFLCWQWRWVFHYNHLEIAPWVCLRERKRGWRRNGALAHLLQWEVTLGNCRVSIRSLVACRSKAAWAIAPSQQKMAWAQCRLCTEM